MAEALRFLLLAAILLTGLSSGAVVRVQGFAFTGVSNRFITPNGDGRNDNVIFTFSNPTDASVTGKIYDLRGRLIVSDLPPGPTSPPVGSGTLMWDGKAGGRAVPSGVYIYEIRSAGHAFSGAVVVIR